MADYQFEQQLVADPVTFQRVTNGVVYVYDVADTENATLLPLKDLTGSALPNPLTSTPEAIIPAFVTTSPEVRLVGGGLILTVGSFKAVLGEAVAAREASRASAESAAASAALAQAPTDSQVDAGVQRANIPAQVGAVVPALVEAQVPPLVEPLVPPLVASAIANDPTVAQSAATMAQSNTGLLPKWKASTAYTAGQQVVAPNGEVVSAKVAFTSGTTYSATNWNPSFVAFPQRELVTGEDINAIRDPGVYTVPNTTVAGTLINWPAGSYTGALIVGKGKAGLYTSQEVIALVSSVAPPERHTRTTRSSNNTTWTPWGFGGWTRGAMPDGTNLDTFRDFGAWAHATPSAITGLPADVTTGAVTVENFVSARTALALQRLTTEDGRTYTRTAKVLAGWGGIAWKPLAGSSPAPTTVVSDAGLSNAVLIQDFTQKLGGRRKVTTATVAFRFDHGLANFDAFVRPEMESRNFKYSLALCSGQWDRTENVGVTASMVNTWVTGGFAEIWNHSKDHGSGDGTETGWKAAILDGLTELQTQIPAAAGKIFGFAPPGSTGTSFGGFADGQTLDQFHATDGGRYILSKHAVAAGYLAVKRVQDGMVRQGMGHITVDGYTLAQVKTYVEQAKAGKTALQIMLHPSRLNTEGYMTTATFVSVLDYIKTEELAGLLKVVSPYEQLLTDVV